MKKTAAKKRGKGERTVMKKIICALFALALAVGLSACGKDAPAPSGGENEPTTESLTLAPSSYKELEFDEGVGVDFILDSKNPVKKHIDDPSILVDYINSTDKTDETGGKNAKKNWDVHLIFSEGTEVFVKGDLITIGEQSYRFRDEFLSVLTLYYDSVEATETAL